MIIRFIRVAVYIFVDIFLLEFRLFYRELKTNYQYRFVFSTYIIKLLRTIYKIYTPVHVYMFRFLYYLNIPCVYYELFIIIYRGATENFRNYFQITMKNTHVIV